MSIANFSVRRPVTVIMVFLGIILLGFISWARLPQELFPSITYPQITVVTSYSNAAPEEIENLITKTIEEAMGTVNNVKRVTSISKEGLSLVMAEFSWGTNMDFAALNVREKIDLIKERLPRESQEPIVMKYNPFDLPVMNLAVTGQIPSLELREFCKKYVKDALEKVEGVASVTISGGDERELLVEIDQSRLRASQTSILTIVDALKTSNLNYPAGTIKESFYEYLIRTMGEFEKTSEISELPASIDEPDEKKAQTEEEVEEQKKKPRRLIFLKDIAQLKDTVKEKNNISRYNGKDSISLVIRKQSGTNTLNVANGVKREIKKLSEEKLPKGVNIQITYDQSQFIHEAISNVRDAALQGAFLSFLVLFFFLKEIKSSLVITTAIPISIMATFCMMYFCKINLNMMSLGGLAMGVGMLVDNSVVVIENIFRLRQLKVPLKESCVRGTEEMVAPIFGSTLAHVAVFLPFVFVVGIAGQVFKQLSLTITFSLLASISMAVSIVPIFISLGKQKGTQELKTSKIAYKINAMLFARLRAITHFSYGGFVKSMLHQRYKVIFVVFIIFAASILTLVKHEKQFLPHVDQRQFIIKVDLSPGARVEITDNVVKKIESLLLSLPETKDVTVNIGSSEEKTSAEETTLQTLGSHQAQIMVNLKKKSKKMGITRSTEEIIQYLKDRVGGPEMENAQIEYIAQETSFGSVIEQGAPIAIEIKGLNLDKLTEITSLIESRIKKIDGIYGVKNSMLAPSPETKLNILKDRASLYGLSVRDIALTTQVALKGYVATKFKEKDKQEDVDVRVRLRSEDRSDLGNLRRLLIHTPMGIDLPLSEVAYFTTGVGPTEIKRVDQQRSVIVTANIYKRNFNQIINEVNQITDSLRPQVPKDYSMEITGEQQRLKESFKSLAFALVLAFTLVYMIMAAEFESLWQPFLIMFTVPLSLIGVAISLSITHTPLSVVAYLGIIMLGGIAVNNGIVLIDFVNHLRAQGYSPFDAVLEASKVRLRPILMTSYTTILGLLPLALGIGEGAELQAPMALTVMGGLLSATFLTLVFIPSLYLVLVERFQGKLVHVKEEPLRISPEPEPMLGEKHLLVLPLADAQKPRETPAYEEPQPQIAPLTQGLNQRQLDILEKLKTLKKITRKGYVDMFAISVPTAARDLKELVDKNLLRAKGPLGPGRWYELC